jgi:hypothetical protein
LSPLAAGRAVRQDGALSTQPWLEAGAFVVRGKSMGLRSNCVHYLAVLAIVMFGLNSFHAHAQPSDEAIWKNFMEWLNRAPPVDGPRILFDLYQKQLIADGASEAESTRQLAVVQQLHRQRSDAWRVMFNNIYKTTKPGFATQPNALLVSTVEGRKPGRALDVGVGQGRNSVFLALKGWDVTGFDMSDEGIATARRNAEQAGVKINAIRNEDHGEANEIASSRIAEAGLMQMRARLACKDGRTDEGIAIYDEINRLLGDVRQARP